MRLECTENIRSSVLLKQWWVSCTVHETHKYIYIYFHKNNFKIGLYNIIHIFKNYLVTVFSVFSNKRYLDKFLTPLLFKKRLYFKKTSQSRKNQLYITKKKSFLVMKKRKNQKVREKTEYVMTKLIEI